MSMNYLEHLDAAARCVRRRTGRQGTRVTVHTLLASLSEGATPEEIRAGLPNRHGGSVAGGHRFRGRLGGRRPASFARAGRRMKIKLDENLLEALARELAALGHEADNVRQEGVAGKPDPDV